MTATFTSRTRWIGAAGLAVAFSFALTLAGPAQAVAPVTPSFGPTTGGSNVTIVTPQVVVDTFEAGFSGAFFCASTGEAFSWGASVSQLNSSANIEAPALMSEPVGVNVTHYGSSSTFALVLGDDGNIYATGQGTFGELGDGTFAAQTLTTVLMPLGVTGFTEFSIGQNFVLAMGDDGSLYSWGKNLDGQLGDGSTINKGAPVAVALPPGVTAFTQFAAGLSTAYALGDDGVLYSWGNNTSHQLGAGTTYDGQVRTTTPVPVALPGGTVVSKIAATYNNGFALDEQGVLYSWGSDAAGALGTGGQSDASQTSTVSTPQATLLPPGVNSYSEISTSVASVYVLGDDLQWYSWGFNQYFQLDQSGANRSVPGLVPTPNGVDFIQVIAGGFTAYARGSDGLLYSWGLNINGEAGVGGGDYFLLRAPTKVLLQHAAVSADFDGVAATSVTNTVPGRFTAVTPAHAAGQVDVSVGWTLNGFAMTPVTYQSGFLYTDVPPEGPQITIGGATEVTIAPGESHTFAVTVTEGDAEITDEPVVTSPDGIESAVTVTPSGIIFDSTGLDSDIYQFTVSWTDANAITASQLFTVTVASGDGNEANQDGRDDLSNTGGPDLAWLSGTGALLALLGASIVVGNARRKARGNG